MGGKTRPKPAAVSVLADEVAQFAALAPHWWDENGPLAPLHRMNPVRLDFIRDALTGHFGTRQPKPLMGLRILDIGCGGGLLAEPLARLGAQVTGIDAATEAVAVARAHAAQSGLTIDYRQGTVEALVADGAQFDAVCALEIIEHVADPAVFTAQVARLVRPGGMALFSTLNRTAKSFALAIVGAEYLLRWVPPGTHHWRQFITPSELARWLRQEGCQLKAMTGLTYDPLRQSFQQAANDVAVNYLLAAVKDS